MPLARLTPLDGEAILPLADAKLHLRVTHDSENSLIESLRDAAIGHVESASGVILAPSSFRWTMRRFADRIELPVRPVTELGEVTYHDDAGEAATYTGARLVDGAALASINEAWPYANGFASVEFTAGLADPEDAPELLAAVKLVLTDLFENRSATTERKLESNPAVAMLIDTYRAVLV